MDTNHTSGDWTSSAPLNSMTETAITQRVDDILHIDGETRVCTLNNYRKEPEEIIANAKLIKNAPKLLKLLTRIHAASASDNNGLINGEAVLCLAFEDEAADLIQEAGGKPYTRRKPRRERVQVSSD